uniref:Variant surface glycoprotein 1125.1395 n=1 Tax=Trypanosoma brucei TaxID=5691 RepID=A0A1J0R701_9TRYP|nr:variant surface glycoprotein 1125.1395 [Trypanosoma brucei]
MKRQSRSFLILLILSAAQNGADAAAGDTLKQSVANGICGFSLQAKKTGAHFAKHSSKIGSELETTIKAQAQQTLAAFKLPQYQTAALITATFAGTQAQTNIIAATKLTEPILQTYNQAMFTSGALDELIRVFAAHDTDGSDDQGCIGADSNGARVKFEVDTLCGYQDATTWANPENNLNAKLASAFSGIHSSPSQGTNKNCLLSEDAASKYTNKPNGLTYAGGIIKVSRGGGFANADNFQTQKSTNNLFKSLNNGLAKLEEALKAASADAPTAAPALRALLATEGSRKALQRAAAAYNAWSAATQPTDVDKYLKTTYGITADGTESGYEKALKELNIDMPTEANPQAKKPLFELSLTELNQEITREIRKLH